MAVTNLDSRQARPPFRLRQPKSRVPGTTTVIDGALIRDLGIMSLVEVFLLVPGMTVGEVGSHQPVATYHGTSHYEQRRMQVLIDGRTDEPTLSPDNIIRNPNQYSWKEVSSSEG
jgi:outer membrane receptor for monomeric catechols